METRILQMCVAHAASNHCRPKENTGLTLALTHASPEKHVASARSLAGYHFMRERETSGAGEWAKACLNLVKQEVLGRGRRTTGSSGWCLV